MSLVAELKQRKVFRVAAAYAVVAWLLIQVVATVGPALKLPDWTLTFTVVLAALGFPVALVLAWVFDVVRARSGGSRAVTSPHPGVATTGAADGIAVLPFANLTGEAEHGYLADGIVDDLLTRLQATPGLRVVSRQSSHAYKGRSVDARTIARELACRYVVEGSMRRAGDRVRVTVQLIDALGDRHVWAERYDRRLEDAFQLQDEICDHVVAAIQSRVVQVASGVDAIPAVSEIGGESQSLRPAFPWRWAVPLLVTVVGLAAVLTWTLRQREAERHARESLLPQLQSLLAKDDYAGAFEVAGEIERVTPNDPVLASLRSSFSAPIRLATAPAGAKVYYRPLKRGDADWQLLGATPLLDVEVPLGVGLWRIEKEGSANATFMMRNPGVVLGSNPFSGCADKKPAMTCLESTFGKDLSFTIGLADAATLPAGMVLIPDLPALIPNVGDGTLSRLPEFYIDRFEVKNKDYKEFVDAGGYAEVALWEDLPFEEVGVTDWRTLVQRFVDVTGRPGPSTWQAGSYPDGTEELPVTGISWYEAAAYCRYRGKELPTAHHWYRAANPVLEVWDSLSSVITMQSNFSGNALQPVSRMGGIGPYGTYDMAGNAREWLWTRGSSGRWNAGGSYRDPTYMYWQVATAPTTDRSDVNGVRCMRTAGGSPMSAELREPIPTQQTDYAALQPVGDAAFAILAQQLAYRPAALNATVTELRSTNPAWTRRRIELPTGYDDTTFAVDLFLPTIGKPPYSVIFYMPHAGEFLANVTLDDFNPADEFRLGYLLKAGRGIAVIAFDGAYQRRWPAERLRAMSFDDRYRTLLKHWREELGRTIDYLAERPDVDGARLGMYGISLGAQWMAALLAVEGRIGAAVLHSGGIDTYATLPQGEWPYNYLPRITQPVMMMSGRFDTYFPRESQDRMFDLLGAPPQRKKHVVFDSGHVVLPRFQAQQLTLDWFDQYLGPAQPKDSTAAK